MSKFEELAATRTYFENVTHGEESSLETLCRIYDSLPIEERPLPTIWNRMKREVEQREIKRKQQEAVTELLPLARAADFSSAKRRPRTVAEERFEFAKLQQEIEAAYDRRDPLASSPSSPVNAPQQQLQGIPRRLESYQARSPSPTAGRTNATGLGSKAESPQEGYLWGSGEPKGQTGGKATAGEPSSNCSCNIL